MRAHGQESMRETGCKSLVEVTETNRADHRASKHHRAVDEGQRNSSLLYLGEG